MVDSEEKDAVGLDPHQLLRALGSLLNADGGARGIPEILRIASLMKDAKKLVARCVYANILKCTTDTQVMEKFVEVGGWETLNIWLQDAKAIQNTPFIEELLQVYQNVPVTIELLKQNNCAKTIKQMSKSGEESLMKLCSELVDRWMNTIKSQPIPKDKSSENKKHKHSKSHSDKKHKHSSSKHEKSSHGDHKPSKNTDPKMEKSKNNSSEKSKDGSSKSSSKSSTVDKLKVKASSVDSRRSSDSSSVTSQSSTSSQTSSAKPVTHSKSEKHKSESHKASSVLSSANVSDKIKKDSTSKITLDNSNKVKTSKTAPTKFRSTGLEQEVVLPPSKKKKPNDNKLPVKRPSPLPKPTGQPPEKKPKSSPSGKDKISLVTQEETHGKIKIIPPKPKPVEVFESSGFMDAITAVNVPSVKIKRKKATTPVVVKPGGGSAPANTSPTATSPPHTGGATSPTSPKDRPTMPSFYKDTLASPTEKSASLESAKNGQDSTSNQNDSQTKDENKENKDEDVASVTGSEVSTESSSKDGKKKKKVTWAAEKELRSYHYFELDETERVNVNKVKNFEEIKKQEMAMERMRLENIKKMHSQENAGSIPWRAPPPITGLPEPLAVPGCNSTEREQQKLREESVLQALFFSKNAIPPTPAEADPEEVDYEEPRLMPLDDESGESVIDHSNIDVPSKPENPPFSLTPEMATLLQSMAQQVDSSKAQGGNESMNGGAAALMPSAEELASLPPDMQSMLQSFMGNRDQQSNDDLINKLKTILEPFNNQTQGHPQNHAGGYGHYPVPGQSLLPTPPAAMFGANMMFGMPPMPPMAGPPMPYPAPPGPGMYRRGGGPRGSLLGPGPMRGPPPMRGPRGQRGSRSGPRLCRHFQAGSCDRGASCGFLHPGINM